MQIIRMGIMWARAVGIACLAAGLSGCVALVADRHTYGADLESPAVTVNGATVRLQMKAEGTENGAMALSAMVVSVAKATFDGPFRWRVDALGEEGRHEAIVIHRIRTRTSVTKRDKWYPERHLGKKATFRKREDGFRASYPIPGLLNVKPREDGALDVLVDLTVRGNGRAVRSVVRFRMEPGHRQANEFIFIPTEIVTHIGKPMEDWDEPGWD